MSLSQKYYVISAIHMMKAMNSTISTAETICSCHVIGPTSFLNCLHGMSFVCPAESRHFSADFIPAQMSQPTIKIVQNNPNPGDVKKYAVIIQTFIFAANIRKKIETAKFLTLN